MTDTLRSSSFARTALVFLGLVGLLLCAEWRMLHEVSYEAADFAANSLLIQDAKRLHLIYGNYSRVGFNHPGPAILYVLAFGELIVHDWLHLAPSAFAGQLVGAILYDAAWITLVFALVRRLADAVVPALLFVAVLLMAIVFCDPPVVTGMWFPDLYVFPYAALLVALAPLVYGRTDTLTPLAVATGFLINGHASFMPMLALMFVVILAFNWVASRRDRTIRILSRGYLARHRRALLAAGGIVVLFLVPLLIATVRDWPGPLADYLHYGQKNKGNTWRQAVEFVLQYMRMGHASAWGLLAAIEVGLLLFRGARAEQTPFTRFTRALGLAFVASTLAVLYYAKVGVDDTSQTYVAMFYYIVPSMCVALLALHLVRVVPAAVRTPVTLVLAVAALSAAWQQGMGKPPHYRVLYDHPDVPLVYEALSKVPGSGRIVLDLDHSNEHDWSVIWGESIALQAYAKRRHVDLACVNDNWHISYTKPGKCRPDELATDRRYEVRLTGAPDAARGAPEIEAGGLSFYRKGAVPRHEEYITVKDHPEYFRQVLGKGWAKVEGEFVWTEGPVAEIHLPADPARGRMLALDFGSFIPDAGLLHRVRAYANGRFAGESLYFYTQIRHRFTLDLGRDPGAAQDIRLEIGNPVSPKDYHVGDDPRYLAVSLYGIRKDPQ